MKRRGVRLLVLLWFGWYLAGPLCETVDFWDTPREEFHDILFNAGGALTLVAAVLCFGTTVCQKLRERCSSVARTVRGRIESFVPLLTMPWTMAVAAPAHSPPSLSLRI